MRGPEIDPKTQDMLFLGGGGLWDGLFKRWWVTNNEAGLSFLMKSHIPHYSTSGVDYTVGYKTCQRQAGAPPSSPLQNRKSYVDK